MNQWQQDVQAFHEKFGVPIRRSPTMTSYQRSLLRARLVAEEASELIAAMSKSDLPEIADACADLIYVVIGTAIEHGIDLDPVWSLVHAANMKKNHADEDGKIRKPEGWEPPDIAGEIKRQAAMQLNREQ